MDQDTKEKEVGKLVIKLFDLLSPKECKHLKFHHESGSAEQGGASTAVRVCDDCGKKTLDF